MIVSQLSSSGKNKVLETASIFYIQGYKGDEKLQIKNNKSFKIYLNREEDSDRFKAYYGEVINGNVIWREDKKSYTFLSLLDEGGLPHFESKKENSFRVLKSANSINQPLRKTLLLSGKKMGWINCDRIVDIDVPSSLDILLDKVNEEFTVRLVLNNKNAIIPGLANSNSINHYKFSKVPEGENGYVLAYKEIRNGYMIAYSKVTIGFIKSINLEPEYKTKQEFEYLIDSFLN